MKNLKIFLSVTVIVAAFQINLSANTFSYMEKAIILKQQTNAKQAYKYTDPATNKVGYIYLQQENGTWTCQVIRTGETKWQYVKILSSNPEKGYFKIHNGTNTWMFTVKYGKLDAVNVETGRAISYLSTQL